MYADPPSLSDLARFLALNNCLWIYLKWLGTVEVGEYADRRQALCLLQTGQRIKVVGLRLRFVSYESFAIKVCLPHGNLRTVIADSARKCMDLKLRASLS